MGDDDVVVESVTGGPIEAFEVDRALSGRTGPGNSGGAMVDATGDVVGMHTWGRADRLAWTAVDGPVVQASVERITTDASMHGRSCPSAPEAITWAVRLGTFADLDNASELVAAAEAEAHPGIAVSDTPSDLLAPFLLSDYPHVVTAGPFPTRLDADVARASFQDALDPEGTSDTYVVVPLPRSTFPEASGAIECLDSSSSRVRVTVPSDDTLTIRSTPGADGDEVTTAEASATLFVAEDSPEVVAGAPWIRIGMPTDDGGACGWVAQRFTTPAG